MSFTTGIRQHSCSSTPNYPVKTFFTSILVCRLYTSSKYPIHYSMSDVSVRFEYWIKHYTHISRYGDLDGEAADVVKKDHTDKTKIDSTTTSGNTVTYRRRINYATVQDTGNYTCTGKSGNRITSKTLFLNVTRNVCGTCHNHTPQQICGSDCVDYTSFCELKKMACLSGTPISLRSFGNCSHTNQVDDITSNRPNQTTNQNSTSRSRDC